MFKWFKVEYNGGLTAVRARDEAEALKRYVVYGGYVTPPPGIVVRGEISAAAAERIYHKLA